MKPTTLRSLACGVILAAGSRLEAGDVLHASRYVRRVGSEGNSSFIQGVSLAVLAEYCGDADGCKVSLKLVDDVGIGAKTTRLYFNDNDPAQWFSEASVVPGVHRDADQTAADALTVSGPSSTCTFGDFDLGVADSVAGFGIQGLTSPIFTLTCTLVVED